MLQSLLKQGSYKKLPFLNKPTPLFTLADKMCADNVIQLCGNDNSAVRNAVQLLQKGQIIAVPTDTVYGLAVDASNSSAIASLYEVKERDVKKPLAICLAAVSEIKKYAMTGNLPKGLIKDLLPGPVTVVLKRRKNLNPDLNPGLSTVGVRVPEIVWFPFIQYITAVLGYPLALTSANRSNEPNCICAEEFKELWPKLGAVYDVSDNMIDYEKRSRKGSTIVDLSEDGKFRIIRPGDRYDETVETLKKYQLNQIT